MLQRVASGDGTDRENAMVSTAAAATQYAQTHMSVNGADLKVGFDSDGNAGFVKKDGSQSVDFSTTFKYNVSGAIASVGSDSTTMGKTETAARYVAQSTAEGVGKIAKAIVTKRVVNKADGWLDKGKDSDSNNDAGGKGF